MKHIKSRYGCSFKESYPLERLKAETERIGDYRPEFSYFYQYFNKPGVKGDVIGVFCNFVPEELLMAFDITGIRMCSGFDNTIYIGEEHLPKNTCPLVKSSYGQIISGINPLFDRCENVIVPSSCDPKKKLADVLSDTRNVWTLKLPNEKDSDEFWLKEIKELIQILEDITGKKLKPKKLRDSIRIVHEKQKVLRHLLELRNKGKLSGKEFLVVVQNSFINSAEEWTKRADDLCSVIEGSQPLNGSRILLTGSPVVWPNWKLIDVIEMAGGLVVADETCAGTQALYNPIELSDWSRKSMIQAIANKYLSPCTCPCFVTNDDRIDRILTLKKDYSIDGVVYHVLRLCQPFDFEHGRVSKALSERNVPMLKIETEYSEEDREQIKTRIEAFMEMINARTGKLSGRGH